MNGLDLLHEREGEHDLRGENARLLHELAQLRRRVAELERLADTDTLTPLANRRVFSREVERVVRQFERHGTRAVVMLLDVDGLKAINDRHGHRAGDAALLHIAYVLTGEVRATDTVARCGGDEFGMVLDHLTEDEARAKAQALTALLARLPVRHDGHSFHVALSIGLTAVRPGDTHDAIFARADADMYAAKAAQRSIR